MPIISHFTAEGYRQFGKRYAEKMLSILGTRPTEPNSQPRHLLLWHGLDLDEEYAIQ
jgi:hypothetical protein